ncbi:farnesyl diphosphate synthase [Tanacetum coccineum]
MTPSGDRWQSYIQWASWHASSRPSIGTLKNVLHCHKRTSDCLLSTTMSNDLKSKFMQVYDHLKSELIHDPVFEFDDVSRQWVDKKLGFTSCKRNSGATKGINVLIEKGKPDGTWAYGVSCMEYTEFDKFGIAYGSHSFNSVILDWLGVSKATEMTVSVSKVAEMQKLLQGNPLLLSQYYDIKGFSDTLQISECIVISTFSWIMLTSGLTSSIFLEKSAQMESGNTVLVTAAAVLDSVPYAGSSGFLYDIVNGKMTRGLSVVDSYQLLKGEELTDDEAFLVCTLGWCIEWLQAYFLLYDDIMDGSHYRRGQPCRFRLPEVGMIAVNDGVLLRSHVARILKKHFQGKAYYVHLLDLFNEAEFQTVSGEMIDVISTLVGKKGLSNYSLSLNRRIIQYKCSYYSFYLPVACALLMIGENLDDHVQVKDILVEMGIYYQVQDDYFDTFGDPKVVGKIGTDIEDCKCSWLIAKALELANEEQKKILNENYGRKDLDKVAKVKELYHTLELQGAYKDYEKSTHEELITSIESQPSKALQAVLKSFLEKIYKRQKYNKDAKVTSIKNLDLQLFKVQLTEFGIGTEDVYGMMSIPVEAIAAYDSLSDDKELIDTYERLTTLNGKRMFPLAVVGSHKKEVGRLRTATDRDFRFGFVLLSLEMDIREKDKQKRTKPSTEWKSIEKPKSNQSQSPRKTKSTVKTGADTEEYLMGPPEPI